MLTPSLLAQAAPCLPETYYTASSLQSLSAYAYMLAGPATPSPASDKPGDASPVLPLDRFVKPVLERVQTDDMAYLRSKDALTLPGVECQIALFRSYLEYVHPLMPILDIDHCLQVMITNGQHGQLSLILYQAIMFAGAAYVHMDYLTGAGFDSRSHARKVLFQQARTKLQLLYDFDCESERLVLVQSLLLLTLWHDSPEEERRDARLWMDAAASQAIAAGLHLDSDGDTLQVSKRQRRLRRRVWWSCYVTDRILSLGTRRPPRIRSDDFQVSMLEESDFGMEPLPQGCRKPAEALCRYVTDEGERKTLGTLFVELIRLCQRLDSFIVARRRSVSPENNSIFLDPDMHGSTEAEMVMTSHPPYAALKQSLGAWESTLPEQCSYPATSALDSSLAVTVHHTTLHMLFQALMLSVHRSTLARTRYSLGSPALEEAARFGLLETAWQISRMASEIHDAGLDGFLPTTVLLALTPAAAVLLQEMGNGAADDDCIIKDGFLRCLKSTDSMQDMYEPAKMAREAIAQAVSRPLDSNGLLETQFACTRCGETGCSTDESIVNYPCEHYDNGSSANTCSTAVGSVDATPFGITSPDILTLDKLLISEGLLGTSITDRSYEGHQFLMEGLGALNDLLASGESGECGRLLSTFLDIN
ncbi:hypothetical protein LRP88_14952 [Fusarium phalaenopsidis]